MTRHGGRRRTLMWKGERATGRRWIGIIASSLLSSSSPSSPFSYVAWSCSLSILPTEIPAHDISPALAILRSLPAQSKAVRLSPYFYSLIYSPSSSRQGQTRGGTQTSRSQGSHRSCQMLRVSIGSRQCHRHQCRRRPNAHPMGKASRLRLRRDP